MLDSDSEEVDDSDQDPDFVLSDCSGEDEAIEDDTLITVENIEFDEPGPSTAILTVSADSENDDRPQVQKRVQFTPIDKRSILWKKKSLEVPDETSRFRGNSDLPTFMEELETPYDFCKIFLTEDFLNQIVEETIRYSVQKDPSKPFDFSIWDLRKYLGICLVMSCVSVPSTKDYWSASLGNDLIKQTMSYAQFVKIRRYLHFANNQQNTVPYEENHDRLFKIRPVVEHFRKTFSLVPFEESLSIDEQMCATKGKCFFKQYMPAKPHKWGIKLFVLCGASGYSYDFEVYTGQENDPSGRRDDEPDLGASADNVVRLSRNIPRNAGYKLYFDNYYTSFNLMVWLAKERIFSLGTVRRNRLPNCKLLTEK